MNRVASWAIHDGHILTLEGAATVSFQRYPEDAFRSESDTPRSSGALPVELSSPRQASVPMLGGEGVWLGLTLQRPTPIKLRVSWLGATHSNEPLRWSSQLTSFRRLFGLRRCDGGFQPFIRAPLSGDVAPCAGILLVFEGAPEIKVQFVDASQFEAQTGRPAPRPISLGGSYGGWRLPRAVLPA